MIYSYSKKYFKNIILSLKNNQKHYKKLNYYYSYRTVLLSIPFYKETNLQCVTFFKVSNYLKRMLRDYLRVTHGEVWAAKQFQRWSLSTFLSSDASLKDAPGLPRYRLQSPSRKRCSLECFSLQLWIKKNTSKHGVLEWAQTFPQKWLKSATTIETHSAVILLRIRILLTAFSKFLRLKTAFIQKL